MKLTLSSSPSPTDFVPSVQLYHGDCLDVMPTLNAGSVGMVFADLPYGVSLCDWDVQIDLQKFWGTVGIPSAKCVWQIFTATQPFATMLINSSAQRFKYDLIWQRSRPTGFFNAKRAPLREHEHVLIFGNGAIYSPQMTEGKRYCVTTKKTNSEFYGSSPDRALSAHDGKMRHPRSIIKVPEGDLRRDSLNGHTGRILHTTQKPVALLEWLIRTYSNEGDTVLDPVFGSCTTGVACLRTGRNFVGIEKDANYFEVGRQRLAAEQARLGHPVTV